MGATSATTYVSETQKEMSVEPETSSPKDKKEKKDKKKKKKKEKEKQLAEGEESVVMESEGGVIRNRFLQLR